MKTNLIILGLSLFSLNAQARTEIPGKAPAIMVTKDYGCGNYECCNMNLDWEVKTAADLMKAPGKGKKLERLVEQSQVRPLESTNFATRGVIKLTVDKAGGKAGKEYFYYSKDSSRGFELFEKSGDAVISSSGEDFIASNMVKPDCKTDQCVGTIIKPSKGETYIKVKTKKNNTGWVNLTSLEPGC